MKMYKKPNTRIKEVSNGFYTKYYAQYKMVVIPYIWEEWTNILLGIDNPDSVGTYGKAEQRVDKFLLRYKWNWACSIENKAKKKFKTTIRCYKYPEDS
jgi:hypothetical protein